MSYAETKHGDGFMHKNDPIQPVSNHCFYVCFEYVFLVCLIVGIYFLEMVACESLEW